MHLFFFFQAEDGIRDLYVTGVQTCALPICFSARKGLHRLQSLVPLKQHLTEQSAQFFGRGLGVELRSEERRVGKECRSGWSPEHEKKKAEEEEGEMEGG